MLFYVTKDYSQHVLQCSVEDQKLFGKFDAHTRPYVREQFGYRKRTGQVKLPLVEERLQFIVRISNEN